MPIEIQQTIKNDISVKAASQAAWHERHNEPAAAKNLRSIAESDEEIPVAIAVRLAQVMDNDHARWLEKLSLSLKRAANSNLSYHEFLTLLSNNLAAK